MSQPKNRVLIVDDELAILKLICRELHNRGFQCDVATDGDEALQLIDESKYDIVVTDLKMPNLHGHALVNSILQRRNRPLVVVHTGVAEPRLATDLLTLGVDDIVFKPTDSVFLAAKLESLLSRHRRTTWNAEASGRPNADVASEVAPSEEPVSAPISFSVLNATLAEASRIVPISQTAVDVYEMTRVYDCDISDLAAAIQRDASLTAEVLRLANSSRYNPSYRRIIQLEEGIYRIGQTRVGELALSASALAALAPGILPWMDLDVTWKRSMASGIALGALIELGGQEKIEDGLLLSAILHPLGRVVLGSFFSKQYEAMINACAYTGEPLRQQERQIFPTTHTEIMAHLLATWRIPPDQFLPLKFCLDSYSSISALTEPIRTKTEIVKTAIILGRVAVGSWDSWDLVQFPPTSVLKRLGISNAYKIVRQTRRDINKLARSRHGGRRACQENASHCKLDPIVYYNFCSDTEDLLPDLLSSMGLYPKKCSLEELRHLKEPWLANCVGTSPTRIPKRIRRLGLLVTDQMHCEESLELGPSIVVPNSYAQLCKAIVNHAKTGVCRRTRDTESGLKGIHSVATSAPP